jgi:hypothetical protein
MFNFLTAKAQLSESFDGATFPPAGWTSTLISDGDGSGSGILGGLWQRSGGGINPPATPHSGTGMAWYNSYNFDPTSQADLITPALNFAGVPKRVSFWMYRSFTWTNQDSVTVYINTTSSTNGATFLGKITRVINVSPPVAAEGWYQYYYDIPASFNGTSNYIIFRGTSNFGLDMFIDDVVVANQPACKAPLSLTVKNYSNITGLATATWPAAPGSPAGYEWVVNTTGLTPASGTAVVGTTAAITGITGGVVNYLFVRSNCGSGSFSTWISIPFMGLPCVTLTSPAPGATSVVQSPTFTWQALAGANSYIFYLGTAAGNEVNIGTTTATSATIDLLPSRTYYWYLVPAFNGVAAPSGCTGNSFTTAPESTTPANNPCSGAVTIKPENIAGNAISSTTAGATETLPSNLCLGYLDAPDDDVWFQFITNGATPAGTLTISPAATGGILDIVAQVYAANSCSALGNPVQCIDATDSSKDEVVDLSQLAPNTHYYMRVYSFTNNPLDKGAFTITASAGNTLPVSLSAFTAHRSDKINVLEWTTQQEINTSHFVIERGSDGVNFTSIGQVQAKGNSNTPVSYTFADSKPAKGNNYYRLKMVDKDNSVKLSDTHRLQNEGAVDITVYPNPVIDKLNVAVVAYKTTEGQLTISDISGKVVYSRSVRLPEGTTVLPVSLGNISTGTYIMKIQLDDAVVVRKFNKQ